MAGLYGFLFGDAWRTAFLIVWLLGMRRAYLYLVNLSPFEHSAIWWFFMVGLWPIAEILGFARAVVGQVIYNLRGSAFRGW